jgi:hypothetical protein
MQCYRVLILTPAACTLDTRNHCRVANIIMPAWQFYGVLNCIRHLF